MFDNVEFEFKIQICRRLGSIMGKVLASFCMVVGIHIYVYFSGWNEQVMPSNVTRSLAYFSAGLSGIMVLTLTIRLNTTLQVCLLSRCIMFNSCILDLLPD